MKRDFYVYILFRPDGSPCYIGKGHGYRWRMHDKWATNPHLRNIIRKAGGSLPKTKLKEDLSEREAFELERELIRNFGRDGSGGMLVNLTDGGEGSSGCIGREHWNGKTHPEAARKIGRALKGRTFSKAWRRRLSLAAKKRADRGGPITEIRREAIRKALFAFWAKRRAEAKRTGRPVARLGWG